MSDGSRQQFAAQRTLQEQLLLKTDRQGAIIQCCFHVATIFDFFINYGQQTGCFRVIGLVSLDAFLALLQYGLASVSPVYKNNRTAAIMLIQMTKLFTALKCVPSGFAVALPVQFAAGKHASYIYKCLAFGLASFHIAYNAVCGRIALRYAFPFILIKLAVSLWVLLPSQVAVYQLPESIVVTSAVRKLIHDLYAMFISTVTAPRFAGSSPVTPCPSISLSLWCHLCLGGLLPLYYLAAVGGCLPGCRATNSSHTGSRTSDANTNSSSSNSRTALATSATATSSSDQRAGCSTAAVGSCPASSSDGGNLARTLPPSQQQQQQPVTLAVQYESSTLAADSSSSYYSFLCHLMVLLMSSMLLWELVDVIVSSATVTRLLQQRGMCV